MATSDLSFGKVTGFFGTNSAGKSSLLQFLLMLKQTRNATDRGLVLDFGGLQDLVNLGTFSDVIHQHNEEDRMSWLLEWTLGKALEIRDPTRRSNLLFQGHQMQTRCQIGVSRAGSRQSRILPYRAGWQTSC